MKKKQIGATKDAANELRDEYLEIKAIIIQVIKKHRPIRKLKPIKKPIYVATPLPPLNFNQTGNKCPKKTIKADK